MTRYRRRRCSEDGMWLREALRLRAVGGSLPQPPCRRQTDALGGGPWARGAYECTYWAEFLSFLVRAVC